jgi:uncharacterized protein (TIGR03437 family)
MRPILRSVAYVFLTSVGLLFGQGPTLVGTGYTDPSYILIAPGQITTLFVTGLKTTLPSAPIKATSFPLPSVLGGISVTLGQNGQQPSPIPLLSIQQLTQCLNGSGSCQSTGVTAITAQIPFELLVPEQNAQTTELAISENGNVGKTFTVLPVAVNLHILKSWDAFPSQRKNNGNAVVTHGDGSPVTSDAPGKAGETVVIYAFGLGQTTPAAKTGSATPMTAPTLPGSTIVAVQFDSRPNAQPSNPYINPNLSGIPGPIFPVFVGLTPDEVGLYQINVKLPDTLQSAVPCSTSLGVASNLTINVASGTSPTMTGPPSFDGAPICVEVRN